MAHVLTIELPHGGRTEIHMLNPGEVLEGFGGKVLRVGKTASLVLLRRASFGSAGCFDTEYDIHDTAIWTWIADLINNKPEGLRAVSIPAPPKNNSKKSK